MIRLSLLFLVAIVLAALGPVQADPAKLIVGADTLKGLKKYQSQVGSVGHGYFAVSTDGIHWAYWDCSSTSCSGQRSSLKSKALDRCRNVSYGLDCVILAEDQHVVLEYEAPPVAGVEKPVMSADHPPAPPADQLERPGHAGWAVDEMHGCWIWDRSPEAGDRAIWTGACAPEGPASGPGVLEWVGRERFHGTLKNGRKSGHGILVDDTGGHFEGEYRDGNHDGHGVYVWGDGSRYEGEWQEDYPNGYGVFTWKNDKYQGQWQHGCFADGKFDFNNIYNGDLKCP